MLESPLAFLAVAVVVTITPGPAAALVLRGALRGGQWTALATIAGNSVGVLSWGLAAALGVSALVAASEVAYAALRMVGAGVLVVLGAQALWRARRPATEPDLSRPRRGELVPRTALRDGVLTSFANPKLAVFFVALFPQFVPAGQPVLPAAVAMALIIIALDFLWYSFIAFLVVRAKRAFVDRGWARRLEQLMGAVLVDLGLRLAVERG